MKFVYHVGIEVFDIYGKYYRLVAYYDEECFDRFELAECHQRGKLYDNYNGSIDEDDEPKYTHTTARQAERYMENMIRNKNRPAKSDDSDPETDYGGITLARYRRRKHKTTTTKRTATKRSYKRSTTKRKAPTRRKR